MPSLNKNSLDTLVNDWSPKPAHRLKTDIGLEVELEGDVFFIDPDSKTMFWCTKEDGSLRNGVEFVLKSPIKMSSLKDALSEFQEMLKLMKPKRSIRTSTHIHKNVLPFTLRQVYSMVVLYYLVEELLIRTQSTQRIGNLFCLRMSDANTIYKWLRNSIRDGGSYFKYFNEDMAKYSALNLCTVSKYGSIEFRFLEAMTDIVSLHQWCELLNTMCDAAAEYSVSQILDLYDDLPVHQFLAKFFPNSDWLYASKDAGDLNDLLHTNYDALREFSRAFSKTQTYQVPHYMWDDDSDVQPEPMNSMGPFNPVDLEGLDLGLVENTLEWDHP